MRKRIIAGLLGLLLLGFLLPGMAMAATRNTTLDCRGFTGDESGDGWSWDSATKTLTITGDLTINIAVGTKCGLECYFPNAGA